MYVSYVTVGETFSITVPLYVVLMSVLGGARHWLGPAVGATIIGASLYAFIGGQQAILGRAVVALALILVILLLPEGVVPAVLGRRARAWRRSPTPPGAPPRRRGGGRRRRTPARTAVGDPSARPWSAATSGRRSAGSRRCAA